MSQNKLNWLDIADLTDEQVMNHLYVAFNEKNLDTFRLLIDEAQQDGREGKLILSHSSHEKPTLLQRACELEEDEFVKILLETKVDVNETSSNNATPPLILAIKKGKVDILVLLLEHPDINLAKSEPESGRAALHTLMVKMEESKTSEETILYDRCLDLLLNLPYINVNIKDKNDQTPLHYAAFFGLEDTTAKLLDKGADPELKNVSEETSFNQVFQALCIHINNTERVNRLINCFKLLLKYSSDSSLLHDVIYWTNAETQEKIAVFIQCLDLILKSASFIDVNIQDKNGLAPLHVAARFGVVEAIEILLENGANPYALTSNDAGQTVLHLFAQSGYFSALTVTSAEKYDRSVKSLRILLEKFNLDEAKNSISLNQQDKFGKTPIYHAICFECEDIVKLFLKNGAHLDKESCKMIVPATLESFLDSCIQIPNSHITISDSVKLVPITFDYSALLTAQTNAKLHAIDTANPTYSRACDDSENVHEKTTFLQMPPNLYDNLGYNKTKQNDAIYSESETLWYLSQFPKHRHLLDHPLVKSFLMLKWHSFRKLYWADVLIYIFYLALFSTYILLLHSGWDDPSLTIFMIGLWYLVLIIDIIFLSWAILLFLMIPTAYVSKFENWIHVPLIVLTLVILFHGGDPNSVRYLSAVAILLAWSEGLILLSSHPKFSTYVTMFSKVSISFLQLFGWFSVLLIGFSFSFFLIFGATPEYKQGSVEVTKLEMESNHSANSDQDGRQFINIYDTFLKSFAMMKDEYDFDDLPFGFDLTIGVTSRLLFILFMFLVTIVMMNLLNGLAIYDIQDIKKQAEIYSYVSQVESFATREFILLLGDPSHKLGRWTPINRVLRCFSPITTSKLDKSTGIIKYIYRKTFLFYNFFPERTSVTFSFFGEIVGGNHFIQPNLSLPIPKSFKTFKLKDEVLKRAQQKALDNKRSADQRATRINTSSKLSGKKSIETVNSKDESIHLIKIEAMKSEFTDVMKQQLNDEIRNMKEQHREEIKELKQQLLNDFRQLLLEQNAQFLHSLEQRLPNTVVVAPTLSDETIL